MLITPGVEELRALILESYNCDYGTAFKTDKGIEKTVDCTHFAAYRAGYWSGIMSQVDFHSGVTTTNHTKVVEQDAVINAELLPDGP